MKDEHTAQVAANLPPVVPQALAGCTQRLFPAPPPRDTSRAQQRAVAKAKRAYRRAVRKVLAGEGGPKASAEVRGAVDAARQATYGNKRYTPPRPKAQR